MVHKINLDAAEAARHEATDPHIEVQWRGTTYQLPIEQPTEVGRHFRKLGGYSAEEDEADRGGLPLLTVGVLEETYNDGLSVLFCTCVELPFPDDDHPGLPQYHDRTCQWLTFLRSRPSQEAKQALLEQLTAAYGVSQGEARAPRRSSRTTSARSPRTGAGSTKARTSAKKSGAGAATKKAAASRRS